MFDYLDFLLWLWRESASLKEWQWDGFCSCFKKKKTQVHMKMLI